MKGLICFTCIAPALLAAALLAAQIRPGPPSEDEPRLPSGSPQREEILKQDHQRNLDDAAKLLEMAEELKIELEKNERHVLSISSLKKTEEIEKLAKRIRGRLKKF